MKFADVMEFKSRSHDGKAAYTKRGVAWEEAHRMGGRNEAYECLFCLKHHIGRPTSKKLIIAVRNFLAQYPHINWETMKAPKRRFVNRPNNRFNQRRVYNRFAA